jgi:hypothetical protein
VIQPEPINARFVGGPLHGETHVLAHRLKYVQVPGPGESFFARLWIERPDCADEFLYEVTGADDAETLVYSSLEDGPVEPADIEAAVAEATAAAFGVKPDGTPADSDREPSA